MNKKLSCNETRITTAFVYIIYLDTCKMRIVILEVILPFFDLARSNMSITTLDLIDIDLNID